MVAVSYFHYDTFIIKCDKSWVRYYIIKCDSLITKCNNFYKMRRLLQNALVQRWQCHPRQHLLAHSQQWNCINDLWNLFSVNPFNANLTKWSNTLKHTNCLSVFDHFVGLAFQLLTIKIPQLLKLLEQCVSVFTVYFEQISLTVFVFSLLTFNK